MNEPERLRRLREEALQRFESLPAPSRTDEEWRRTDPAAFASGDTNKLVSPADVAAGWEIPPGLKLPAGVILADLDTALRRFPDVVDRYLLRAGEPGGLKKFFALHQARWQGGLFGFVPQGIRIDFPLKSRIEIRHAGSGVFPHVLLVLEEGAQATVIDERRGPAAAPRRLPAPRARQAGVAALPPAPAEERESAPTLSTEMVEIFLRPGAALRYVHLQRWGPGVAEVFLQKALVERDAQLFNVTIGLGGRLTKGRVETVLQGAGARSELLGILFGSEDQHYDFHTVQDHESPGTTSDLLYKSALRDRAKSVYTGLIRIARHAQKSDAYQANRNLLLSKGAKADSIPMLEIEADDVRCTHGVAVGPMDPDSLFYLMSRGIPMAEAERLIVGGFFEPVLQRIPLESLRQELAGEVSRRLANQEETADGTMG